MFREIYDDSYVRAMGVVKNNELIGIVVTFHNVASRRLYYKTNSNMFIYKGRWFHGEIAKDTENTLYLDVDRYGYILVDNNEVIFKEIQDVERL